LRLHRNEHRHPFYLSRRTVLCSFAGLVGASPFSGTDELSFSVGLTPVLLDNDMRFLTLLQRYLMWQLERPVALVKRRSQRERVEMLLSGQLDAAWISDLAYVEYQNRLTVLASPLISQSTFVSGLHYR
jgi:ABC-type phosphate/phosphonate transport system substrate-binding protein